tara:strand:- start:11119 stop:12906 length:1788 start_codon:yes stop_codon:yes gene_type:complete
MANYTTTNFRIHNKKGSSSFLGNLNSTSGSMRIIPNGRHVVSASDFSIRQSNIPSIMSSVVFSDITTAGEIGNEVLVTFTFSDTFVANKNIKVSLKIDGDAKPFDIEKININTRVVLIDNKNKNKNGSSTVSSVDGYSLSTETETGVDGLFDIITNEIIGSPKKNKLKKISTLRVDANDGYRFLNKPSLKLSQSESIIKLKKTKAYLDSNKNIIGYDFDIMQKSNNNITLNDIVYLNYNAVAIPALVKEIRGVVIDSDEITDLEQTKTIKVFGNLNAKVKLTITKQSDGTSILDAKNVNSTVLTPSGIIDCALLNFDSKSARSFKIKQKFPAPISAETTLSNPMSSSTTMDVTSKTGISVGDKVISGKINRGRAIKVATINPSHERITVTESLTLANSTPVSFARKEEKYFINLYPLEDTTLGSNIPTSEPRYTITQRVRPVLTLKATSTHATANPADIVYVGKANKRYSDMGYTRGAIGSTATLTERTDYFKITYTFTASTGNWTTSGKSAVTWSSTDQSASRWTNSVHADTIPAHGGTIVAGNGGTHIEISNINVAGMGTGTATLTANVLVKKFGNEDVTMIFDADNCFEDGA